MKILELCTYPINEPRHGGQLRVSAIDQQLRNAGHIITHLACYPKWAYPEGPEDIWTVDLPSNFLLSRTPSVAVSMNLYCSDYIFEASNIYQRLTRQILNGKFDLFIVQQLWLWPLLKRIRAENPILGNIPVVCSSHNIESKLFEEVIELSGGLTKESIEYFHQEARRMEEDCVRSSQLALVVTENDKIEYMKMGGENIRIFPNAINPPCTPTHLLSWQERFKDVNFGLFVSSPFLPNSLGVVKFLTPAGFLAPDQKIVIGGLIGQVISENFEYLKHFEINNARFDMLGKLEPGDLAAVYQLADVIVLPIIGGAGSNLKTAEAIYSQKPILATSYAMRGYEEFDGYNKLIVEDNPTIFRNKLFKLLSQGGVESYANKPANLDTRKVLWEYCLLDLPQTISSLIQ